MKKLLILGSAGFIGSALIKFLEPSDDLICTVDLNSDTPLDYDHIYSHEFEDYDSIVLLAGLSSVALCKDYKKTFHENVVKFVNLVDKLKKIEYKGKFLFASSASVYGNSGPNLVFEGAKFNQALNYYDLSKQTIDNYAALSGVNYYGLRFGTLSGYSPNPRVDLLVNALAQSAKKDKALKVNNCSNSRSVLGMQDCCRAIRAIIDYPSEASGFYNLASLSGTIGQIAQTFSRIWRTEYGEDIELQRVPDSGTYSFCLDTSKFERTFNFRFEETLRSIIIGAASINIPEGKEAKYIRK